MERLKNRSEEARARLANNGAKSGGSDLKDRIESFSKTMADEEERFVGSAIILNSPIKTEDFLSGDTELLSTLNKCSDGDLVKLTFSKIEDKEFKLSPEQESVLDWYYGNSLRAVHGEPTVEQRKAVWKLKETVLEPGYVILACASNPYFHFLIGLGQIQKYSNKDDNRFRFWTHPAIVVWKKDDKYADPEKDCEQVAEKFMIAQSVGPGVGLLTLEDFLVAYKYRCWAFKPKRINPADIPQIQQSVIGYTHLKPQPKLIGNVLKRTWVAAEYGVLTIFSIVFGLLFGRMRLRFSLASQVTCSGFVADLLERGGYRFTEGETHAFPADVARRVMEKQYFRVAPPEPSTAGQLLRKMLRLDSEQYFPFSRYGYHHGVIRLFEQFPGKVLRLFAAVLGILIGSLFCFLVVVYASYILASAVSINLSGAAILFSPTFWGALSGALIASVLSLRIFPFYSYLLIPIGLLVDLYIVFQKQFFS